MRPLKYKELLYEIALRSSQPSEVIENLLKLYWQELRNQLSTLKYSQIQVLNLGTFVVKQDPLKKKLQRRRSLLDKIQGDSPTKSSIRANIQYEISLMELISEITSSEVERKRCIRNKRTVNV